MQDKVFFENRGLSLNKQDDLNIDSFSKPIQKKSFSKMLQDIILQTYSKQIKKTSTEHILFEKLLNANMLEICAEMLSSGLQVNKKNEVLLKNKIHEDIKSNPNKYKIYKNIYHQVDFDFKLNLLLNAFTNAKTIYDKNTGEKLFQELKEDVHNLSFNNKLIQNINIRLLNYKPKVKVNTNFDSDFGFSIQIYFKNKKMEDLDNDLNLVLNTFKLINLNKIELDYVLETKSILINLENNIKVYYKKYGKYISKNNKYEIDNLNLNTICINVDNFLRKIIEFKKNNIIDSINLEKTNQNLNQFKTALSSFFKDELLIDKIKNIFEKYEKIQKFECIEYKVTSANKIKDLNNMFLNYKNMDVDFIKSLKNVEGKTADDLLLESLNNIEEFFEKIIIEENSKHLTNISVLNRKNASISSF